MRSIIDVRILFRRAVSAAEGGITLTDRRGHALYSPIPNTGAFIYRSRIVELRRIRYFIAVAEELNFTRAAERLHIAQPPLSTQIRALEEELGARLFERDKRHVFLTQAGRHFLLSARGILASVEDAKLEVRSAAMGAVGKLQFGYTASSMFTSLLPAAIRRFRTEHPHVSLALSEMTSLDQLNALHHRTLDAGILRNPGVVVPPGIQLNEWYRAPLVLAVAKSHPLAKLRAVYVQDLRDQPLITYPRASGIGLYWHVMELCAKAGFRPRVVQEVQEPTTIVGLVAADIGVAIVPADTKFIQLKGVVYVSLLDSQAVSTLYLAFRRSDNNPHLGALLSELRLQAKVPEHQDRRAGSKRSRA
jgi:DNA-binding transcriptional LysR family regulator